MHCTPGFGAVGCVSHQDLSEVDLSAQVSGEESLKCLFNKDILTIITSLNIIFRRMNGKCLVHFEYCYKLSLVHSE